MMSYYIRDFELWKIAKNTDYKKKYIKMKNQNKILLKLISDIDYHLQYLKGKNFNQIELANFINFLENKLEGEFYEHRI